MTCSLHPNRNARSTCETCGALFCEGCLVEVKGKYFCKAHVAELIKNNRKPPRYSHHYHNYYNFNNDYPYKSRFIALLLCVILGFTGLHRFYVGKTWTGVLYFFTG